MFKMTRSALSEFKSEFLGGIRRRAAAKRAKKEIRKIKITSNSAVARPLDIINSVHKDGGAIRNGDVNPPINGAVDLTIVIPFFNSDKYIAECLESVFNQKTRYKFRVLLVDDGSTDKSLEIAEKFAAENNNAEIFVQKNGGQSFARNNAIDVADGRYIMFVDSDDVLFPCTIENLMITAEKSGADIVEGGLVRFYGDKIPQAKGVFRYRKTKYFSYKKRPEFSLTSYGYSVAKIYDRRLWNGIRFPEGYIFEDIISKFALKCKAKKCAYINSDVYGYRINQQSSSHKKNNDKVLDCFYVLDKVLKIREEYGVPFDGTMYLQVLCHVGLLCNLMSLSYGNEIQNAAIAFGREKLIELKAYRPKKMPTEFLKLEQSIIACDVKAWNVIAELIRKNNLLAKYREIN